MSSSNLYPAVVPHRRQETASHPDVGTVENQAPATPTGLQVPPAPSISFQPEPENPKQNCLVAPFEMIFKQKTFWLFQSTFFVTLGSVFLIYWSYLRVEKQNDEDNTSNDEVLDSLIIGASVTILSAVLMFILLQVYIALPVREKKFGWGPTDLGWARDRFFRYFALHRPILQAMDVTQRYTVKDLYEKLSRRHNEVPELRTYVLYGAHSASPRNNYQGLYVSYISYPISRTIVLSPAPVERIENMLATRTRLYEVQLETEFTLNQLHERAVKNAEQRLHQSFLAQHERVEVCTILVYPGELPRLNAPAIIVDATKGTELETDRGRLSSFQSINRQDQAAYGVLSSDYIESGSSSSSPSLPLIADQQQLESSGGYKYANNSIYNDNHSSLNGPLVERVNALLNFLFTFFFSHTIFLRLSTLNLFGPLIWFSVWRWCVPKFTLKSKNYVELVNDGILPSHPEPTSLSPIVRETFMLFDENNMI